MSLNGLDAAAVVEAHQAAQADAGGWLLLKYINRDTVDLLKKGTGGVAEVRNAIEEYTESSPLYGLVQHRRKKIILKYVPKSTSRLLQVRLTVQFQSVLEFFNPHDTVFSLTTASELTESSLAMSAKFLQQPNGSLTSSNSSLRLRRLNEITEDVEENGDGTHSAKTLITPSTSAAITAVIDDSVTTDASSATATPPAPSPAPPFTSPPAIGKSEAGDLPASAVLAKALLAKRKEADAATSSPSPTPQSIESPRPKQIEVVRAEAEKSSMPPPEKSLPETPELFLPTHTESLTLSLSPPSPKAVPVPSNQSQVTEIVPTEELPTEQNHSRHLSTAESDSISQWSSTVASYAGLKKKKQKLGPRPHVDTQRRPKTSGTSEEVPNTRPVANLPNSVRLSTRSFLGFSKRPGSQQSSRSVPALYSTSSHVGTLPPLPSPSHIASLYKAPDSRATVSRPPSVTTEMSTASPEKLRLMKALQMRKRNVIQTQRATALPTSYASSHGGENYIPEYKSPIYEENAPFVQPTAHKSQNDGSKEETTKTEHVSSTNSPSSATNNSQHLSMTASSFTSNEEANNRRGSLSSDTSSSITPKAVGESSKSKRILEGPPLLPALQISANPGEKNTAVGPPIPAKDEKPTSQHSDGTSGLPAGIPYARFAAELSPTLSNEVHRPETLKEQAGANPVSSEESTPSKTTSLQQRQRGKSESLHLASGGDGSDDSDDDSLMDELQNATVHEAKPMSVARTPVTPILSKPSSDRLREMSRARTASINKTPPSGRTTPDKSRSGSARSVSTALPQWPPLPTEPVPVPLTKKATLGTGISKRIKALEVLSSKDSTSPPSLSPREASGSRGTTFTTFIKRSSFMLHTQAPAPVSESPPKKNLSSKAALQDSKQGPTQSWLQRQGPTTEVFAPSKKGETVSVTARIVRDGTEARPTAPASEPSFSSINLHRSPLIVEHGKHEDSTNPPVLSRDHFFASLDGSMKTPDKNRPSFSSYRSSSQPQYPHSEPSTRKLSFSSTHKKQLAKLMSDNSSFTEEKSKSSRTSRMLKRMSNLTSSSRRTPKNQLSPQQNERDKPHPDTIQEHVEPASHRDSAGDAPLNVIDIGDVNVQFPESLLWKRRFMKIDDQGYIIFSPPANEANARGVSRRYHLRDFKVPSLPDREREEMAWSILLDLQEGNSVQCACESKTSQQQVLQMLVDAHRAYHQLYAS